MRNVRPYVEQARFPASKQELIRFAREHNAPGEVLETMQRMADRRYGNVTEVVREISL